MNLSIGTPIATYSLFLIRKGIQGFVLDWYNDTAMSSPANSINGKLIRIVIGGDRDNPIKTYDAIAVQNKCTYNLTSDDTDLDFIQYDGLILLVEGSDETPLIDLHITVGPS
jgi:hypothetical protein